MNRLEIIEKWLEGEEVEYYVNSHQKWDDVISFEKCKNTLTDLPACISDSVYDIRLKPKHKYANVYVGEVVYLRWTSERHPPEFKGYIGYLFDKNGDGSDIIFVKD